MHPQYQGQNAGHQNYRIASGSNNRQSLGQSSAGNQQMNQRGYNPGNISLNQNMPQQFQAQNYATQNLISNEQLQEQIQKLIKNNKKHFSKDQSAEELHKYLK